MGVALKKTTKNPTAPSITKTITHWLVNLFQIAQKIQSRKCLPPQPISARSRLACTNVIAQTLPLSLEAPLPPVKKDRQPGVGEPATALSPVQRCHTRQPPPAPAPPCTASPHPTPPLPRPTPAPCAEPWDRGSLSHPVCFGCCRVTAVPRLITDGLRLCQPMNKITVVLQCKYHGTVASQGL